MIKKNRNIKALIIFGLIFLTPINGIMLFSVRNTKENDENDQLKTSAIYYNVNIDDLPGSLTNWTWAESQPWFGGGSGSISDPYIIEGHTFDALGTGSCLSIENSEKYFIIRNCLFNNSGNSIFTDAGLYLSNVTNANITDNDFTNNHNGIYFEYCYNNEILSNNLNDNGYVGIWGQYSNNYTNIYENSIANSQWGIAIDDGTHDVITNNSIINSYSNDGILLYGSGSNCIIDFNYIRTSHVDGIRINSFSDCVVHHNTIINSTDEGLELNGADDTLIYENYFINNNNNAVDNGLNNDWNNSMIGNYWDDYLGYDMNLDGIGDTPYDHILGSAGTIDYLPIWNIQEPIEINDLPTSLNNWTWAASQPWCSGSGTELNPYIIEDMNIDANLTDSCITIRNSEAYFIIQGCKLFNSSSGVSEGGVFLQNVTHGTITGNEFHNHRNAAIYGLTSNNVIISDNIFNNHRHGIYLEGHYNEILSNSLYGDGSGSGIVFQGSFHDNLIEANTIENCWQGMFIFNADNNTFIGNTALKNLQHGIALTATADDNYFQDNFALNNTLSGMIIDNSVHNIIERTRAIANQQHGIYLTNADYTTIYHNRLIDNINDGVHLATGSANNLIYRNFFGGNGRHAFDDGASNDWNSTDIGNYWDNHTSPDTSPVDGIVDTPYLYIGGGAGSIDYLPIAEDGAPIIVINYPSEGQTFGSVAPDFVVTITDIFLEQMWYSLDGGLTRYFFTTNGTIDQTAWDELPEGTVTITFYANDSAENLSSESVSIVKSLPEGDPFLLIIIVVSLVSGIAIVTTVILIRRRKARKQP